MTPVVKLTIVLLLAITAIAVGIIVHNKIIDKTKEISNEHLTEMTSGHLTVMDNSVSILNVKEISLFLKMFYLSLNQNGINNNTYTVKDWKLTPGINYVLKKLILGLQPTKHLLRFMGAFEVGYLNFSEAKR